jgi:hypothetical protein
MKFQFSWQAVALILGLFGMTLAFCGYLVDRGTSPAIFALPISELLGLVLVYAKGKVELPPEPPDMKWVTVPTVPPPLTGSDLAPKGSSEIPIELASVVPRDPRR